MLRPAKAEEELAAVERAMATLRALFMDAGHAPLDPPNLLDADLLLDLYGEDVRTRAFIFPEPIRGGELCLRPDFTAPVALAHAAGGWDRRATYCYGGPVFRLQDRTDQRKVEYLQAGIERYGEAERSAADAKVFALVEAGLEALGAGPRVVRTGDPSILFAVLEALDMPDYRRAALRRHFWRPSRFRALILGYFAPDLRPNPRRTALFDAVTEGPDAVDGLAVRGRTVVGARGVAEIAERAEALAERAGDAPMPGEHATLIEQVLAVAAPSGLALARLRDITGDAGVDISAALERFEKRLDALNRVGIDAEDLAFDARFGRNMEYYDGFVFEVLSADAPNLPPLAGGGRYDRMTLRLGAPRPVPACGAMIRVETAMAAAAAHTEGAQ